jgi:cystathionine beta-lyase/cystathionine gamma-synthase
MVSRRRDLIDRIFYYRQIPGGILHADATCSILCGRKTLALRIERSNANAGAIAEHLAGHPKVGLGVLPGPASHPGHTIA